MYDSLTTENQHLPAMKKATTTLFAQLVGMMPRSILEGIAAQFYKPGNASKFTVWDQLVAPRILPYRRVRLAARD